MSKPEHKRVTLTTISNTATSSSLSGPGVFSAGSTSLLRFGSEFMQGRHNGESNKAEETSGKKSHNKSIRLNLELFQTDSSTYPEFNYSKLIFLEKKKIKKLKEKKCSSDPFEENDDDVKRIAKELEQKYGNAYGNVRKTVDHSDKGVGYDESDSFIDNTDAYDEVIPEEVETLEGGFYINCGALVFKNLQPELPKTKTNEIIKMPNRPKKRILSSSSDDSSTTSSSSAEEEDDVENDSEDSGEDTTVEKTKSKSSKSGSLSSESSTKKHKSTLDNGNAKPFSLSSSSSNSPKPLVHEINSDSEKDSYLQKPVKTTTVKDMLKAKRDSFLKSQAGSDTNSLNGEVKGVADKMSDDESSENSSQSTIQHQNLENVESITPTLESEINSIDQREDTIKPKKSAEEPNLEKLRSTDTKLPELESEIINSIVQFRETVKLGSVSGKKFYTDDQFSQQFLKIDESLQRIDKTQRNMVFAHLEFHLGLPKYYLLRKGKQLRVNEENLKSKRAITKVRKVLMEAMKLATFNYEEELRKFVNTNSEDLNSENPPNMPQKKFPWTTHLRNLVFEAYQVRYSSFPILGGRKETIDDFMNIYIKEKLVKLWPTGWMSIEEIKKEIENLKVQRKSIVKKSSNTTTQSQINPYLPTACSPNTKHFEEFPTTSRSCANSDAESVASSVTSKTLKRKNKDNSKQSKTKAPRTTNTDKPTSSETISSNRSDVIKKQQLPITTHVSLEPAFENISTRTEYNTFSITSSNLPPSPLNNKSNPIKPTQKEKHSTGEMTAHVINLDNFKSTKDILQTSKQLLSSSVYPNSKATTNTINISSEVTIDLDSKSCSSSESDCVEIVEIIPARPTATQKQNKKNINSNQYKPSVISPYNNVNVENTTTVNRYAVGNLTNTSNYGNNNNIRKSSLPKSVHSGNDFGIVKNPINVDVKQVAKTLKELEDKQLQQSRANSASQSTFTKDRIQ